MKSHAVFALLFAIGASEASAQAYYCSRPSEPYIPLGYTADYDSMQRAQQEVADYFDDMKDYVECMNNETNDALSEASNVDDDWTQAVQSFNNR